MPLQDHFHSPWKDENPWEAFHSSWANTTVRQLNASVLSSRYRALPHTHLGDFVEADVITIEEKESLGNVDADDQGESQPNGGVAVAVWTPPKPVQTLDFAFPDQDVFEVRIVDELWGRRLAAVIEFVSPNNKDRPEKRRAFVAKCATYLQQQIGLVIVDIVANRRANLHQELLELFELTAAGFPTNAEEENEPDGEEFPSLYAVAYRTGQENDQWRLDLWPHRLTINASLPTMPLWLASNHAVPFNLEECYQETRRVLRIDRN